MNNGIVGFEKNYPQEEFVSGEANDFLSITSARFIDGAQTHLLAPLGPGVEGDEYSRWRTRGVRRDAAYMTDYIRSANLAGMPVTIDVYIGPDGARDEAQWECLRTIGEALTKD